MYKQVNGKKVALTASEISDCVKRESDHDIKLTSLEATKYQRDRYAEYPDIEEQLDMIYHLGLAGWKSSIKAIKDKYPKPEGN